ncbi:MULTISPECIES: putative zinc-binding metallopeptidase [unclassified Xanthobacter]|uniref:zinc-binding metallopeptidase family protein n=1 Tax=unclassified Xanthobacter TaxID=2623496 RepID=UPI001F22A188|nr:MULTISPECIES: putative zinc-binding peptidase [unclassified Xanthobacter]
MRLFQCEVCGQLLYFENRHCEHCGHRLGYLPGLNKLVAVVPDGDGVRAVGMNEQRYRFCANAEHDTCNWLVPEDQHEEFCLACRHNRTVPDLTNPAYLKKWRRIEMAKHRLIYSLLQLQLPLESNKDREGGLCFDFLADPPEAGLPKVMTGHDSGLITIALTEADDAEREQRRNDMGELYRTLLGHFRHEVGHYYWDLLVRDAGRIQAFRAVFGDESVDYAQALNLYYDAGPPQNWQANHVSAYATAHPWEDFAETFKHYIHIVDTLEMAGAFGMQVDPMLDATGELHSHVDFNPYGSGAIQGMVNVWLPIAFALNSLNRCLGMADAYPFILTPGVIAKLGFVHQLVHQMVPADADGAMDAPASGGEQCLAASPPAAAPLAPLGEEAPPREAAGTAA